MHELIVELQEEEKRLVYELEVMSNPFPGINLENVRRLQIYQSSSKIREAVESYGQVEGNLNAVRETIKLMNFAIRRHEDTRLHTQATNEAEVNLGEVKHESVIETMHIVEPEAHSLFDAGSVQDITKSTDYQVDKVMERPVLIGSYNVAINTDVDIAIQPWSALLNNPTIAAKYRNFAYFRADLVITISVSCSQFHYGTLMAAYYPLQGSNAVLRSYMQTVANYRDLFLRYMSQATGASVLRLHDNKPIELRIPYINLAPMIKLYNDGAAASTTLNVQATQLGTLFIKTLNRIRSVNATAPTTLNINVHANFENVKLSGVTGTQVVVTTEATNEAKTGPVQRVSTALADASDMLSTIPIIAPYAKAGSVVFRALSKLSAIFGFSVPAFTPAMHGASHIRPDAFQNSVTSSSVFMGKKLTLDHEQELTVDPRIAGMEEDEMSFASITKRESLLDTFSVSPSAVPMSTILWRSYVGPGVVKKFSGGAVVRDHVQPTALGFVAQTFTSWHGDIIYKFQVNKSQYHKCKIAVMFEPNVQQNVIINSVLHLNKQRLVIVDISETDTFEVCVPFVFSRMWARTGTPAANVQTVGDQFSTSLGVSNSDTYIGFLTVYLFTSLQAPDNTPIDVNVYISSKNIKFNGHEEQRLPKDRVLTQAHNQSVSLEQNSCFDISEYNLDSRVKNMLHYGEQPVSFRQYLKRYFTTRATLNATAFEFTGLPNSVVPQVLCAVGLTGSVNSRTNLFDYLRYAYLGLRGSFRKRLRMKGTTFQPTDLVTVHVDNPTTQLNPPAVFNAANDIYNNSLGYAFFVPSTNGGIEVEVPFYNDNLFIPSGLTTTELSALLNTTIYGLLDYRVYNYNTYTAVADYNGATVTCFEDTSIGEDFTFLRFMGAPFFRL